MDAFGFIFRFLMILFIIQISHRSAANAKCIDCGFGGPGMGCCKLHNGTEYCEFLENCPTFDKENATSEEKSSEENENDIEINLNINLNGPSEKKMASGRVIPKPNWPAFPPKTSAKELSDSVNNRCYCRYKKSAYYCC